MAISRVKKGGKAYVVTGGAKGIGRAITEHLAGGGARVAVWDPDAGQGRAVVKRLGKGALYVDCDISDPGQVEGAVEAMKGFPRLDGLVNNAGIGIPKAPEDLSVGEWDRVLNTNLRGAFLCVKALLPRFKDGGAVVNIASTRALMSEPNSEAYAASKGGILALTHALALSLQKRRIRVNAVSPGWIDTSRFQGKSAPAALSRRDHAQHPAGRVGRPEDIAEIAAFLLDASKSGFMTGQNVVVDGGMTVKMIYED